MDSSDCVEGGFSGMEKWVGCDVGINTAFTTIIKALTESVIRIVSVLHFNKIHNYPHTSVPVPLPTLGHVS